MSDNGDKVKMEGIDETKQMIALVDVINGHAKTNAVLEGKNSVLINEVKSANMKIEMMKTRFRTQMVLVVVFVVLIVLFCKRQEGYNFIN